MNNTTGRAFAKTGRIRNLHKKVLNTERMVSIEQALLITESYKSNPDLPRVVQRAYAFKKCAAEIRIAIDPDELIIGNRTAEPRAGVIFPESGISWLEEEIENLPYREQDSFNIKKGDVDLFFREIVPFWKGRTLEDSIKSGSIGATLKETEKVIKINQKDHAQGHIIPDVETWIRTGPAGLLQKVKEKLAAIDEIENSKEGFAGDRIVDRKKGFAGDRVADRKGLADREEMADLDNARSFLQAIKVTLEGAIIFIGRYAELAESMMQDATPGRRIELEKLAGICRNLTDQGAGNFHEALQSLWFLFVLLQLESNASSFSPGRMDQYLLSYLEHDIAQGLLNEQEALELIESLWLKFNQVVYMRNSHSAKYFAGFPIGFNVAIGGQTATGSSAVNQLSWLMLKAHEHIGLPQPNLSARLANNTEEEFIEACSRVIGKGSGMPQIFNDEAVIPALIHQGIPREEAMNYGIVGCVELSTHGNFLGWSDAAMFNMVKVMELTLFDGICQVTGRQTGLRTGTLSDYSDYENFERALEKQMDYFIDLTMNLTFHVEQKHAEILPSPFLSSVVNDCIGKGLDVTAGGATHNFTGIQFIQVANLADSLAVLKQEVFDTNRIGKEALMSALKSNFKGHEALRIQLLEKVPKYGNDIQWVDTMGNAWAEKFAAKISQYRNPRNGRCHTGFYTVSAHVPMGENVGATPDGRLAGTPLADGGLSAVYGRDLQGPTALLNSVSRINSMNGSNGALLNIKFTPDLFKSDSGIQKFTAFLRSMVKLKITHIQINVVNKEDLIAAREHPELYRHLIIRVAGYSAYFTDLSTVIQDEIISRTTY